MLKKNAFVIKIPFYSSPSSPFFVTVFWGKIDVNI